MEYKSKSFIRTIIGALLLLATLSLVTCQSFFDSIVN